MTERKKFEIISAVTQGETPANGKKFEVIKSTFVALRQTTPSGKMTITNNSKPRKCPFCLTEGKLVYMDNGKCLCKECKHTF